MTTLFISDLHLDASRPEIALQFERFLRTEARTADSLYILGDLFESWVGDDDPNPHYATTRQNLRELSDSGIPVFFMHGNRDFMVGEQFAEETGITLLSDPVVCEVHGARVLLSHGDAWCTDDHEYQEVRAMTRDPNWQKMMLAKPLEERLAYAANARAQSAARGAMIDDNLMDVNPQAIRDAFRVHDVSLMLHGHTHRPAVHEIELDGEIATRIVLGDWFDHGSVVRWDEHGPALCALPRSD